MNAMVDVAFAFKLIQMVLFHDIILHVRMLMEKTASQ